MSRRRRGFAGTVARSWGTRTMRRSWCRPRAVTTYCSGSGWCSPGNTRWSTSWHAAGWPWCSRRPRSGCGVWWRSRCFRRSSASRPAPPSASSAGRALAYAHACGIVHRDVKGANILIDSDGRVMVSDFGVALRSADVTLTADGTVIGTPPFMSPEQCAGRRAGPQSDQYSLGIVAFQMLAGSVPFHADTLAGVMHHHFFTPVPDLTQARDDLPAHLLDVVRRALNKDPDRRFKTTREMLTAIEATAFSERDRQKSERTLQHLVQGRAVKRITTHALPPLAEMPTLAMAALPAIPARRWRPTSSMRLAVLTAVGLVAVGAAWLLGRPSGAPAPARGASSDSAGPDAAARRPTAVPPVAPAPRRVAIPTGRLRLFTTPTTASIWIDGRRVGTGSVYDEVPISPGARHLEVRAPGYETFDTTVVIEGGGTVLLKRVTLRSRGAG